MPNAKDKDRKKQDEKKQKQKAAPSPQPASEMEPALEMEVRGVVLPRLAELVLGGLVEMVVLQSARGGQEQTTVHE